MEEDEPGMKSWVALLLFVLLSSAIALGWFFDRQEEQALVGEVGEAERDFNGGRVASFASDKPLDGSITLDNVTHPSLGPPLPSKLTFVTTLPPDAVLDFAAGVETEREVWRAKVRFQVTVETATSREVAYREVFRSFQQNRWHPRRVELTRWSGETVRLTLEVGPAYSREPPIWADRVRAVWGNPMVSTSSSRGWLQTTAAALLQRVSGRSSARSPGASGSDRPSILFILVDTLRADYLGSYGFNGDISPNLDRLAAASIRFENCSSQAPWTKPSIASLFTSLYPGVHGVTNHDGMFWGDWTPGMEAGKLPEPALTLAEIMQKSGYRTAAFIANPLLAPGYGFEQGFDSYEVYEVEDMSRILTDSAIRWMDSDATDKPFFAYLHFMNVHGPYRAPEADYLAMKDSPSLGTDKQLSDKEYDAISDYLKRVPWAEAPEVKQLRTWRARYAAGVREFDRNFLPFLEEITHSGLLDETLLVLTSDHGEELAEHGGWDHGHSLFEHQLRIPLLIRMPEGKGGGREVANVVSLVDLLPTLLTLAGIEHPDGLQGHDISALLADGAVGDGSEASFSTATSDRPGLHSVRTRQHKLITDLDSGEVYLFDFENDSGEQQNIAEREPGPATRLHERLRLHLEQMASHGSLATEVAPISEEMSEQLRKLGYVK
jgi:arylsulfatase A-like enzyme